MIEPLEITDSWDDTALFSVTPDGECLIVIGQEAAVFNRADVERIRDWLDNYLRESEG